MNQFLKRKAKEKAKSTKEDPIQAQVEELLDIVAEDAPVDAAVEVMPTLEPEEVVEAAKERKPRVKRQRAYNVFKDSATNKYMMVTIEYTIKTGYSSIISVEPIADNWRVAMGKVHDIMALKLARGEETEDMS